MIYMGRDKVESTPFPFHPALSPFKVTQSKYHRFLVADEDLIRYAWPQDVWFHVDKLSSAHVYLRMPANMTWDAIPAALLTDCAQLVKANSIEGMSFLRPPVVVVWRCGLWRWSCGAGTLTAAGRRQQEG